MARRVEGVFRTQAQAGRVLQELKERGLDRDVSLVPQLGAGDPRTAGDLLQEAEGGTGSSLFSAGTAPTAAAADVQDPLAENWSRSPLRMTVRTSARQAPEVAQVLRQCGAEEVDIS